jgi:hypothetical protein
MHYFVSRGVCLVRRIPASRLRQSHVTSATTALNGCSPASARSASALARHASSSGMSSALLDLGRTRRDRKHKRSVSSFPTARGHEKHRLSVLVRRLSDERSRKKQRRCGLENTLYAFGAERSLSRGRDAPFCCARLRHLPSPVVAFRLRQPRYRVFRVLDATSTR